jgi:hypothetical protein
MRIGLSSSTCGALIAALGLTLSVGQAFAGDVITINKDHEARRPSLATDEKGNLNVAYLAYETGAKVPDVFFTRSTDGGKSFKSGVNVSKTPGISWNPCIACGKDGHVVIVWLDTTSGIEKPDVYSVFSTDGGETWSDAVDISNTPGKSFDPVVTIASDGVVHAVWADTTGSRTGPEIFHSLSTDKGATWSKARNISMTLGDARRPAVACGPANELFICWADKLVEKTNTEICFASSKDGGKTFTKAMDVSFTPGNSTDPDIAVDEKGNIYLAWADTSTRTGQSDIFCAVSHDRGKTWEKHLDLAPAPGGHSTQPAIFAGEGRIALVWRNQLGHEPSPEIWLAVSADQGKSFSEPKNVSTTPGLSMCPDVVISNGEIHTIWDEYEKGFTHLKLMSLPLRTD